MKIAFLVQTFWAQKPTHTTTHLAYEALRRNHEVAYTTLGDLSITEHEQVLAQALIVPKTLTTRPQITALLANDTAPKERICLNEYDAVFLRHSPSDFGLGRDRSRGLLIDFGRLLERAQIPVFNSPEGLSIASSKTYLFHTPAHIRPKTMVSRQPEQIKTFLQELNQPAILKPLVGHGGQNVFFIQNTNERNINQIISLLTKTGYVLAQEYLPPTESGEKRLLLLNGKVLYANKQPAVYARKPGAGEFRHNIQLGAKAIGASLSTSDQAIVDAIGPQLRKDGLYFVGIDVVENKLLEINVFCPGGIDNVNRLNDINVGEAVIKDLEERPAFWQDQAS